MREIKKGARGINHAGRMKRKSLIALALLMGMTNIVALPETTVMAAETRSTESQLNEAKKAYEQAVKERDAAQTAFNTAQKNLNQANSKVSSAEGNRASALKAQSEANTALQAAKTNLTNANSKLATAENNLKNVQAAVGNITNAQVISAKAAADSAKKAYDSAVTAESSAKKEYDSSKTAYSNAQKQAQRLPIIMPFRKKQKRIRL